jgi:hypothetical protein
MYVPINNDKCKNFIRKKWEKTTHSLLNRGQHTKKMTSILINRMVYSLVCC